MHALDEGRPGAGDDPSARAERKDEETTLLAALRGLPLRQQEVVRLKFQEGMSYREIGAALGITSNNAGVRINRALARLKAALPHLVDGAHCLALSAPEARV